MARVIDPAEIPCIKETLLESNESNLGKETNKNDGQESGKRIHGSDNFLKAFN